jgi:antitoxin VapB
MALHLEDPELAQLATEVADLARESEVEAVRKALLERKERLLESGARPQTRTDRAKPILDRFWANLKPDYRGRRLTREEEDELLGFGPDGV